MWHHLSQMWDALHEAVLGADLEDDTFEEASLLHIAAKEGEAEMVEFLLLNGDDIDAFDAQKWTPVYVAAYFGSVAVSLALVEAGADVNIRCGALKRTVVHMAAQQGQVDILSVVIEHGADVNVSDTNNNTPLHAAATANLTSESIDVLVEAGANMEAIDRGGCTPLHNATIQYSLEGLRALLRHGANINDTNLQLRTPLVFAASHAGEPGAVEVVDLLLRSGADETIVDDQGRAAADVVGWLTENYGDDVKRDVNRVRQLLANAPADRAWRRRGYLVLCRAHPDRVQLRQNSSSTHPGTAPRARSHARQERAKRSGGGEETIEGNTASGSTGDWPSVVAMVLGVREQGLFRSIVEYL